MGELLNIPGTNYAAIGPAVPLERHCYNGNTYELFEGPGGVAIKVWDTGQDRVIALRLFPTKIVESGLLEYRNLIAALQTRNAGA